MDSSTKNLKKCDSTKQKDMNSGTMVAMEQGKNNENKGNDIIKYNIVLNNKIKLFYLIIKHYYY